MLLLACGFLIGVVLGLTGAGGGILAVPALVAVLGWDMAHAAPVALLAVSGAALVGTIAGLRQGLVRWRAALLMAAAGAPLTYAGQLLATHLSQTLLQVLFALVMLLVALRNLLSRENQSDDADAAICKVHPETGRFIWAPLTGSVIAAVGALAGFLTGLLGVGGGFAIVPALRHTSELVMAAVVSTSLMVITLVSGSGIVIALVRGVPLDWSVALPFLAALTAGMLLGRRLLLRLPQRRVMHGFAVLLVAVSGLLLWRALG